MKENINIEIRSTVLERILEHENNLSELVEDLLLQHINATIPELNFIPNEINYVYAWLNPMKRGTYNYPPFSFEYQPFYIGKGRNQRYSYMKYYNSGFKNVVEEIERNNLSPIIIKIKENLSNLYAYKIENYLISAIGKNCDGGPLVNICGGKSTDTEQDINQILHKDTNCSIEIHKQLNILKALNNSRTIQQAADKLGISARTLFRRIDDMKIQKDNNKKYYLST